MLRTGVICGFPVIRKFFPQECGPPKAVTSSYKNDVQKPGTESQGQGQGQVVFKIGRDRPCLVSVLMNRPEEKPYLGALFHSTKKINPSVWFALF